MDFLEVLKEKILLGDGGISTMLYNKGVYINRCFDEINLSNPSLVQEVHEEYMQAGAEILTTNTFGANTLRLKRYGLEEQVFEINQRGAELARRVADRSSGVFVAGSMGPLDATIEPYGRLSQDKALESFSLQAKALDSAGVDLFVLETFSYAPEILLAIQSIRNHSQKPIIAQITIDQEGRTPYGGDPEEIFSALHSSSAEVLGLNCSTGPQDILSVMGKVLKRTQKPIAIYPNAGLPKQVEDRQIYLSTPEYFSSYTRKFLHMGAKIVGGCCGTTPQHIQLMRSAIRSIQPVRRNLEYHSYQKEVPKVEIVPLEERSQFSRKIQNREIVSSIEITPPRGCDPTKVLESAKILKEKGIDAINIPDGPRASSRMSAMLLSQIIEEGVGIETVMHYTCRDRNLLGIQADLLGAYAMGLRNILIITGDPPKLGDYPDSTAVFDLDSIGLTQLVRSLNKGMDVAGNPIGKPCGYFIGVGVDPGALDLDLELQRLEKKIEAGAHFAVTQPVFDPEVLFHFLDRVKSFGIPLVAGIWPLVSYRNAEFMNNEVPGVSVPDWILKKLKSAPDAPKAREIGIGIARQVFLDVKDRIQGIQVSAPFGKVEYALQVLGID